MGSPSTDARGRATRVAVLVMLTLASSCTAGGDRPTGDVFDPSVSAALDQALATGLAELGVQGAAAAVQVGEARWRGAVGVADTDSNRRVTVDTPFRLASITKTYVAALTLRLVDEEEVALDEPVGPGGVLAGATVRQLLNHSSGLAQDHDGPPPRSLADLSAWNGSVCMPGSCLEYGDLNYHALGFVIERETERPLDGLLRELLAERGLRHTWFDDDGAVPALTAVSYDEAGIAMGSEFETAFGRDTWAAGAMVATVDDVVSWTRDLVAGGALSESRRREMLDVVSTLALPCPTEHCPGRYGLGVEGIRLQGREAFGHEGSTGTFSFHVPEEDLTIAVLTNRVDGGRAARMLATRLAAAAGLEEHADVWMVDATGANVRRLTDADGVDGGPAWSPDGASIVFGSTRDGQAELYIMDVDGTNQRRLTRHPAVDGAGRFSPDGGRIVFASDRAGNFDLWTVAVDGSGLRRLTDSPVDERLASYGPDGRIAFEVGPDGDRDLAVINADGSGLAVLARAGDQFHASWAPQGGRIAYQEAGAGIWTVRPDGTQAAPIPGIGPHDRFPSWGPTGAIAFNTPRGDLWVTDPDGRGAHRVMLTVDEEFGAWWSPDGTRLIFPSDRR